MVTLIVFACAALAACLAAAGLIASAQPLAQRADNGISSAPELAAE